MVTWNPKANEVFLAAVERQPRESRNAYLDEACGDDAVLREQVDSLLAASDRAGSFLELPALTIDQSPVAEYLGTLIGPYKLLQQIGEGGMGVVFMAEQSKPIQRTVALKVVKPGMDTRQVIARFEAERQALALMDHPNIARVLDVGTTDAGRPYFVMDLVKGVWITDYCDQHNLPVRERLQLMATVCDAVQHAHQKGIIHRDLKPSNILVAEYDGRPVPKIIDFGVAKATAQRLTEKTMFTELGQMVGTVEYMSPEQACFNQLDIDTRSDVYSLGVLLYELLTGSTPFARKRLYEAAFDEMLRIIREEEPPRPSTRLSSSDTLPSIAANRSLEPLKLNRLVKGELDWIVLKALEKDRNRRYETASGFAADIERHLHNEPVEAGPLTTIYRFRKFVRRHKLGVASGLAVATALVMAVIGTTGGMLWALQERKAASIEAAHSQQVAAFLQEMLRGVGPSVARGRDTAMLKEILETTSARVEDALRDEPEVEAELCMTLGNTYAELAYWERAEALFARAAEHYRVSGGAFNSGLGYAMARQGMMQVDLERTTPGLALAKQGVEIARRSGDKLTLAKCLLNMGRAYRHTAESKACFREAAELAREFGNDPLLLADALADLDQSTGYFENPAQLEATLRQALALHEKYLPRDHPTIANDLYLLGQALRAWNRHDEAEELIEPISIADHRIFGHVRFTHLQFMCETLLDRGKTGAIETLLKQELTVEPNDPWALQYLGELKAYLKDYSGAADEFLLAAERRPNDQNIVQSVLDALRLAGRTEEFQKNCRLALDNFDKNPEPTSAHSIAKGCLMGQIDGEDLQRAFVLEKIAAETSRQSWVDPWQYEWNSVWALREGRLDAAAEWAERAFRHPEAATPTKAIAYFYHTEALARNGRLTGARASLARGVEFYKQMDRRRYVFGGNWRDYEEATQAQQRAEKAIALIAEAGERPVIAKPTSPSDSKPAPIQSPEPARSATTDH